MASTASFLMTSVYCMPMLREDDRMTDMKIGIVGASGRMGRAVIRQTTETSGCVVAGASERLDSDVIGRDAGEIAGCEFLDIDSISLTKTSNAKSHVILPARRAIIWYYSLTQTLFSHRERVRRPSCLTCMCLTEDSVVYFS